MPKLPNVTVVDHPLVQHKLTVMRKRETTTVKFRQLSREVPRCWPTRSRAICR